MVSDGVIFVAFFVMVLILGLCMYQIYQFMPVVESCNDDFDMINKCRCVPSNSQLSKLFPTSGGQDG